MTIRFNGELFYTVNVLHYIYGVNQTSCTLSCKVTLLTVLGCGVPSPSVPAPELAAAQSTISSDSGGRQSVRNQFTSVRPHLHTAHNTTLFYTLPLKIITRQKMLKFKNMCQKGMKSDYSLLSIILLSMIIYREDYQIYNNFH